MKKLLKFIAYAVGAIVALALLLVLTLPLWLGPVVKPTVSTVVPKITGTSFELGHLYLNPYTGRLEVGGFVLGNPKGYSEPVAVSLSNLVFDAGMTTLADKYVHVEEITIDGLFASYLNGGEHDVDNFTQIQYNIAGGKDEYEEAQREKAEKAEKEKAEQEEDEDVELDDDISERKIVIDRLTIKNVRIKYGLVTIPVPVDIVLTDIGKKSGGATFSEICEMVWKEILKSAGAIGDGVKAIGSLIGDGASKLTDQVSKLGDGVSKATSAATESVGKAASGAAESVGKTASGATESASKVASDAAESVGKAVDSVGDGAKKAADKVKNLLNF